VFFGTTKNGDTVERITLTAGDLTLQVLTYGAIVQDLRLKGVAHSLMLGSEGLSDYEGDMRYFGAIVGPIANRISNARVRLDGMMYELERNENGAVHLHSGADGVHAKIWKVLSQTTDRVTLGLTLADGVAGLPGRRDIMMTYQLSAPATLTVTIDGTTDTTTCMNFASHIYWNLDGTDTWDGHTMKIDAAHYLPLDDQNCPTGDIADIAGTAMDFCSTSTPAPNAPHIDHNFCLSGGKAPLRDVFSLTGKNGVAMTLGTTEAGLQIHDAAGTNRPGKADYEGLAVEPQGWPDAPNHRGFPSIKITPDAPYHQTSRWRFERP